METAAQEVESLLLCSALAAAERARATAGVMPLSPVRFVKILEWLRLFWLMLAQGAELSIKRQVQQLPERFLERAGHGVSHHAAGRTGFHTRCASP